MGQSTNGSGQEGRFGTFGGVFTPCVLTILGVIMFLRLGEVVGHAGIADAITIVLLAKLITTTTALSLSAIATNTRVRGGGAYFLISRSLGAEFGGAIGVVFYLAQAVSVAMYVIGFSEALQAAFPGITWDPRVTGTVVNLVVFVCVYIGAGWAIKLQYGILAILMVSVVAFVAGAVQSFDGGILAANMDPDYEPDAGFFAMFALFFPAATGIMAGANMSGDLRDPGRSIPRGTLGAIGFTLVIYLAMVVLLGGARDRLTLQNDHQVVSGVAVGAWLITAGVFAATLSSALGSMMGAPRILQALARDRIFRVLQPFRIGAGPNNEPRNATVLTLLIAEGGVLLGDLNAIAPIITMFFMITYGSINLATFYESISNNPSYRPTFRFSTWSTELLGAIGCFAAMLLISPGWAGTSILAMAGLHWYLGRKEIMTTWGDVHSGALFERARQNLLRLEEIKYHPKNWRPSILALGGGMTRRAPLATYAHWLTGGRGVLTLAQVLVGDVRELGERRTAQRQLIRNFIREHDLQAFPAVIVAGNLTSGIESLVQCEGIGALRPNLVVFGWPGDASRVPDFCAALRTIHSLRRSLVILKVNREVEDPWITPPGTIDVWWRGQANGQLLLLLAHLLSRSNEWRGRTLRLIRMIPSAAGVEEATAHLAQLTAQARIRAKPVVEVSDDFESCLSRVSAGAAVVFLGFVPPEAGKGADFVSFFNRVTRDLPNVILVNSSGDMELQA